MDEKIKSMWQNNKILFFLLIIPITLWFLKDIIMSMLVRNANSELQETKDKDKELAADIDSAKAQAQVLKASSDQKEAEIAKIKDDADWNEKGSAGLINMIIAAAIAMIAISMIGGTYKKFAPPYSEGECFQMKEKDLIFAKVLGKVVENKRLSGTATVNLFFFSSDNASTYTISSTPIEAGFEELRESSERTECDKL